MLYSNRILRGLAALFLLCTFAVADFSTLTAALVKDLASPDLQARIKARQLLPRHGVDALDDLFPLLSSEDQGVRLTAYNVIADILNLIAQPGHEADRETAATQLMALVAPDQSELVKLQALRLLTIATPESADVAPVAALLANADANLREKARESLTLIATDNACDAMIDAAAKAEAPFVTALLDAVATLKNPRSLDRAAALASHADPGVRAAAIRAVAWSGKPAYVAAARKVLATSTPETQTAAYDALLRVADGLALNGGNWNTAIAIYKEVLASPAPMAIHGAALMGLGRNGDSTVIDTIVAGAVAANGSLDDVAAMALTALQGAEGVRGVIAVYPKLSEPVRVSVLSVWGQQKQVDALDLVTQELNNANPALRSAALHALASIGSMKGFAALVDVAKNGNDEEKAFALASVKQMAGNLGGTGDKQAAGLAFVQLYGLTTDEALRADALRGIAANPVPQAFDVAKDAYNNAATKPLAVEALASVAGALSANKEPDKAIEAAKLVQSAGASAETVIRMIASMGGDVPPELANLLGVVRNWQVIGPFDWKTDAEWTTKFVGEPNIDLAKSAQAGATALAWKPVSGGGPTGVVDLGGALGMRDRCFAYAYTVVDFAEEADGQIRLGSDDGNQVWLNGKQVFENRIDRGAALDQDKVDVHFVKGKNTILVKISQGGGGWNFMLRLAKPDGTGIAFTQP